MAAEIEFDAYGFHSQSKRLNGIRTGNLLAPCFVGPSDFESACPCFAVGDRCMNPNRDGELFSILLKNKFSRSNDHGVDWL
jgi:hypothetical protein